MFSRFTFTRKNGAGTEDGTPVQQHRDITPGEIDVSVPAVREQLAYAGVTEQTLGMIATWKDEAIAHAPELADRFYDHLQQFSITNEILHKNSSVERQRPILMGYFASLFDGKIDDEYIAGRTTIGNVHDRVGLGPLYYAAMHRFFVQVFTEALLEADVEREQMVWTLEAFTNLLMFDTALIVGAYADARQAKVENIAEDLREQMAILEAQKDELLQLSEQLAAASEEALAATQEMSSGARTIAGDAEAANEVSVEMREVADSGRQDVQTLVASIEKADGAMTEVRSELNDLTENAQEIETFVSLIGSIADQTNLLALNAAIEAARAGEAGRGFAVVAAEVKTLAESTSDSLSNISELVAKTERSVGNVAAAIDAARADVASSVKDSETVNGRFKGIVGTVASLTERFDSITAAIAALATNTHDIEQSAEFIADMATKTSELASR